MVNTGAKVAMVTTGQFTIPAMLRDDGVLLLGDAFDSKIAGEASVTQMLVALHGLPEAIEGFKVVPNLALVSEIKCAGEAPGPAPHDDGPVPSEPAVRYLHVLQRHPDRVTWMAQRWGAAAGAWEDVVIKLYLSAERHREEVECYRALAGMAGAAELLAEEAALPLDGEERPRVGLVVGWAGSVYDVVPPAGLERAERILREMHRRGVAHGDGRGANLAWDPAARRAFVLDLSHALARRDAASTAEIDSEFRTDLQRVGELVEDARASARRPSPAQPA
jgi:hypothetical protein